MKAPKGFYPLSPYSFSPYWPEYSHHRRGTKGHDFWSARRSDEFLRVVYSNHARIETIHKRKKVKKSVDTRI